MSSDEDDDRHDTDNGTAGPSFSVHGGKKRRIQRACDICRRKKIRCDGAQMQNHRCSNCVAYNLNCTYIEAAKKRGPSKGYVESLENRLQNMEKLLGKLMPPNSTFRGDFAATMESEAFSPNSTDVSLIPHASHIPPIGKVRGMPPMASNEGTGYGSDEDDTDDELNSDKLVTQMKQLALNPVHLRFFGKSSGVVLIQKAISMKMEYAGEMERSNPNLNPPAAVDTETDFLPNKREMFWTIYPWERERLETQRAAFIFPDEDLMKELVDLYFTQVNILLPLLHRPTFEKDIADGLHLRNDGFGSTVLLVCAIGSRYTNDPRVFLDEIDNSHSSGWKWFEQVHLVRRSFLTAPQLYDLQLYCLSVLFLQGSSAAQATWTLVGIGIRLAQDVGAHRRRVYQKTTTAHDELWKRAWWVLICLDRSISAALGRPCAIQDEDFDVDLPVECDDEYWDHEDPEKAFKQPPGKPSIITYFNCYIRLFQILAFALRTIYSINKSKLLLGFVGPQWEMHIVRELDSALNKWIDSVPDHLRWDPTRQNVLHFNQSASLYANYYHLQILIHRPFIPAPGKPSPLSFPSLAICTNAARSCSHVIDLQRKRSKMHLPLVQMAVFTAGIVLLLNIWGGRRSGLSTDPVREMEDVHKCMRMLRSQEQRWHSAGRYWDVLFELASAGDLPMPEPSPMNKRDRDSDDEGSSPTTELASNATPSWTGHSSPSTTAHSIQSPSTASSIISLSPGPSSPASRDIAGSRRVSQKKKQQQQHHSTAQASSSKQTSPPAGMSNQPVYLTPQPPRVPQDSQRQGFLMKQQQPQQQQQQQSRPQASTSQPSWDLGNGSFLPMYSNDLGRIPLHAGYPMETSNMPSQPSTSGLWYTTPPSSAPSNVSSFDVDQFFFGQLNGYPAGPAASDDMVNASAAAAQQMQMSTAGAGDTIAMWSNAPTGFELEDWGSYISNVSLMQGEQPGRRGHQQ